MSLLGLSLLVVALSWVLTGLLRRYALSRSLMDIPNERSSHNTPTPRGGGVAIVVTFLGALIGLLWLAPDYQAQFIALLGAGAWIALIGFMDDHGHIAARWRLLAHFTGAGWAFGLGWVVYHLCRCLVSCWI